MSKNNLNCLEKYLILIFYIIYVIKLYFNLYFINVLYYNVVIIL